MAPRARARLYLDLIKLKVEHFDMDEFTKR